jgi:HAD superfamily hydrolase (TIGR01509 family)
MSRTYDAVTFDAGNTIVYLDHDRVAQILEEFGVHVKPERLRRAEMETHAEFDRADLIGSTGDAERFRAFLGAVLARAGVRAGPAYERVHAGILEANRRVRLWDHVPPKVPRLLTRLRSAGYRLGVVSNSDGRVKGFLEAVGLASFFDVIVDSFVVKLEKPDPRIYGVALDALGVPPHRAVHVGDYYHIDIVGAERAGMTGVLLDPLGLHAARVGRRVLACPVIRKLEQIEAVLEGREPVPTKASGARRRRPDPGPLDEGEEKGATGPGGSGPPGKP